MQNTPKIKNKMEQSKLHFNQQNSTNLNEVDQSQFIKIFQFYIGIKKKLLRGYHYQ